MSLTPVHSSAELMKSSSNSSRTDQQDLRPSRIYGKAIVVPEIGGSRKPQPLAAHAHQSSSSSFYENTSRGDSDETSVTAELTERGHDFFIPDDDNSTTVNYINPHSAKMQQRDIEQIRALFPKYLNLIREYFPKNAPGELTREQLTQLNAASNDLISSVTQLRIDANAQREEKDFLLSKKGREIPFFVARQDSLPVEAADKIRKYLNKKIVLDPEKPLNDKKALSLINTSHIKSIPRAQEKHRFLYLMLLYKEALRLLCDKLNGTPTDSKQTEDLVNEEGVDKLIRNIKRILHDIPETSSKISTCMQLVAQEITVRYVEGTFQQLILEKVGAQYLRTIEKEQDKEYSYKEVVAGFFKAFNTESNTNPATEFERAIKGGILTWVDKDDKVLLEPFNSPVDPFKEEALVQEYVFNCQKVVGKMVFHDDTVVVNFSKLLNDFANAKSPASKVETSLEAQARIFNVLGSMKMDPTLFGEFHKFMNDGLMLSNKRCMIRLQRKKLDCLTIIQFLMLFYRAPFQTYITEPTKVLRYVYAKIFGGIDKSSIIDNLTHWKDDETKKIRIWFGDHTLKFQFLRRGSIGRATTEPTGIIIQDLTIQVPRPGRPPIENPVSLQFYYEVTEGISRKEREELDINLERIAFVLRLLKFPPLKQVLTK